MKHISEKFTEDEFDKLNEAKGDKSWREWMLDSAGVTSEE